ncbi:glycosyltransferase family 4 protein [uncultured Winogradskyella sp.]|uniref:glycosyltransferase family 4 protein n=1 Tax=uncultured Winogradskyella sp. TaxID=395353 RepID=UPI0026146CF2|nr:glycosyltransferase family 4 protein [uncultured Winogradskyella sp.]
MNVEVILISHLSLPFPKIASWTNMYQYLLKGKAHPFDHIICPEVNHGFKSVSYQFLRKVSVVDKVKGKLPSKSKYANYQGALDQIIKPNKKYVIQIVDNSGIIVPIHNFLSEKHDRKNFFIQYYFQGFAPIISKKKSKPFLYAIDELFFLSHLAYKEYLNFYDDCPFKVRIMYNAIDVHKFNTISIEEKHNFRREIGLEKDHFVFMWCSQDRPKKGLHIVLDAFAKVYKENKSARLIIVGINREINQEGVLVVGRVENHLLPKYYQQSDVYLFPSLWKEGFGIVLAEALHCGCYVIASNQGSIKEVLGNGDYGRVVEYPNIVAYWVDEMQLAISQLKTKENPYYSKLPRDLYSLDVWSSKINNAIDDAKHWLMRDEL